LRSKTIDTAQMMNASAYEAFLSEGAHH
jgi:hypothetical protein